jgi:hypothetical protein
MAVAVIVTAGLALGRAVSTVAASADRRRHQQQRGQDEKDDESDALHFRVSEAPFR